MKEKVKNIIKYPEQRNWREKLQGRDKKTIAELTGYTYKTIREMLNGYRLMPDTVKASVIKILTDREALNKTLDEI